MEKEEIKRKKRKALEKDETQLPPISPELQKTVDIQMAINEEVAKKSILEEPEKNLIFRTDDDNMTILNSLLEKSYK